MRLCIKDHSNVEKALCLSIEGLSVEVYLVGPKEGKRLFSNGIILNEFDFENSDQLIQIIAFEAV